MQPDTSDLAVTIVYSTSVPAYGLELKSKNRNAAIRIQKIIFSGTETNYKSGCEDTPYSKCNSEYCYFPTYDSGSRLRVYSLSDSLSRPVCIVYYYVAGKVKRAVADSISITPCKIAAIPGQPEPDYPCYWLNGCND